MNQGGYVHYLFFDASKAFDNVHYVKLFQLLLKRGLCPLTVRFLINLYTSEKLNVRWGNCDSFGFAVSNVEKQGGAAHREPKTMKHKFGFKNSILLIYFYFLHIMILSFLQKIYFSL